MFRTLRFSLALTLLALPAFAQQSDKDDKPLDVQSSVGDLHMGKDADAQKAGLPVYPGARISKDKENDPLNFGIFTESFGLKLVVVKYESDDPPAKVLEFYRDKMRKYGKVLECRGKDDTSDSHDSDDDNPNKPLKCEGNQTGPVRELKVGTEGNAHIVALESPDSNKGTTFAVVYLHRRGKSGDI
jgi:hypothetical protein